MASYYRVMYIATATSVFVGADRETGIFRYSFYGEESEPVIEGCVGDAAH